MAGKVLDIKVCSPLKLHHGLPIERNTLSDIVISKERSD